MCVLNETDRFGLVKDVIRRVPGLAGRAGNVAKLMDEKRTAHAAYIRDRGEDMPEVVGWSWGKKGASMAGSTEGDNV